MSDRSDRGTVTVKKAANGGASKASESPRRLSDAQLGRVMAMLNDLDSVELKLSVPASAHRAAIQGVGLDPVECEPRQVFFFDTPDLALNQAGLVVRARRMQGGLADTVIKLRPVVPADLPTSVRKSGACKIELDALPGGYVCSASMKGKSTGDEVNEVVDGEKTLSKLFTREQREFYAGHAPSKLKLDDLVLLGPTFLLKSEFFAKKLDRKVVAELWLYPDGSRILELSTKSRPRDAFQTAKDFIDWLGKRGIATDGAQETKTATALKFFSAQLRVAAKTRAK